MKLSIITVNLNDKAGLEKTVKSVISQSFSDFEFIIIDGQSTDGSIDVIDQYKSKISYWVSEKDSGIYNAMNKAIDLVSGDWICFMNSGDMIYDSNVLKNVLPNFDDELDVVYGDWEVRYENKKRVLKGDEDIENIWKGMLFSHQSCFVKKDILKQYKFNETNRITADYELFYTLYKANKKFRYIPMIVASVSAGGLSDIKRVEVILSRWKIIDKSFIVNIYYLKLIILELIKIPIKKVLRVGK